MASAAFWLSHAAAFSMAKALSTMSRMMSGAVALVDQRSIRGRSEFDQRSIRGRSKVDQRSIRDRPEALVRMLVWKSARPAHWVLKIEKASAVKDQEVKLVLNVCGMLMLQVTMREITW